MVLKNVPEISQLVGSALVDKVSNITAQDSEEDVKAALKQLFTQIMSASERAVADVLSQLTGRLRLKDNVSIFSVTASFMFDLCHHGIVCW